MTHTGTVEKTALTSGGFGNQWTWIDGVKYATYWDYRTRDWKEGDRVTFEVREETWHVGNGKVTLTVAQNLRKVREAV